MSAQHHPSGDTGTEPAYAHTPPDDLGEVTAATDRLLQTLGTLGEEDLRGPSLLPGWTRGHVLAHVARNAEAMRNLVAWARTGVETPMYASREQRNADIERDAVRSLPQHRVDLTRTAGDLAADLRAVPVQRLAEVTVRTQPGREFPASEIAWRRLREVEIHHTDLGCGYGPADWAASFVTRCLGDVADMFATRPDAPAMTLRPIETGRQWRFGQSATTGTDTVEVSGPERALLAWLIGRAGGEDLTATPPGPLPQPPIWA